MDGLRKAGLEERARSARLSPRAVRRGTRRRHRIAVLPFANLSADPENQGTSATGYRRGDHQCPHAAPGPARHRAHIGFPLPRRARLAQSGRGPGGPHAARGERSQGGRASADHGPARGCRRPVAHLERALRPRTGRRVRDPGRDLGGDRGEAAPEPRRRRAGEAPRRRTSRRTRRCSRRVTTSRSSRRRVPSGRSTVSGGPWLSNRTTRTPLSCTRSTTSCGRTCSTTLASELPHAQALADASAGTRHPSRGGPGGRRRRSDLDGS